MSVLAAITVPNVLLTVSNYKLRGYRLRSCRDDAAGPESWRPKTIHKTLRLTRSVRRSERHANQRMWISNGNGSWTGTAIVNRRKYGLKPVTRVRRNGNTCAPLPQPAAVDSRLRTFWWATAALADRSPTPIPSHSRQEACRVITPPHRHVPLRRPVISCIT